MPECSAITGPGTHLRHQETPILRVRAVLLRDEQQHRGGHADASDGHPCHHRLLNDLGEYPHGSRHLALAVAAQLAAPTRGVGAAAGLATPAPLARGPGRLVVLGGRRAPRLGEGADHHPAGAGRRTGRDGLVWETRFVMVAFLLPTVMAAVILFAQHEAGVASITRFPGHRPTQPVVNLMLGILDYLPVAAMVPWPCSCWPAPANRRR